MSGKRKKRVSTVGRRTGVDVVADKRIELQVDGFEDFNGYWTPSEGSSISWNSPEKLIHSSPKISNVQRMSSYIEGLPNSAKSDVRRSINFTNEPNSTIFVSSNVGRKGNNYSLRNRIIEEMSTPDNAILEDNSFARKKISENRKLYAKGRRTGVDMFRGKNIRVDNGVEEYEGYWTDTHSEVATVNNNGTDICDSIPSTPKSKHLRASLRTENNEMQNNSNCVSFQSPAVSSTVTTPAKSRSSVKYNSPQLNIGDQLAKIGSVSSNNESPVSLRKRSSKYKSPVSVTKGSPTNKSLVSSKKGLQKQKSPFFFKKVSSKYKLPFSLEKRSVKGKTPASLKKASPKDKFLVSVNLLPIFNKSQTTVRMSTSRKSITSSISENRSTNQIETTDNAPSCLSVDSDKICSASDNESEENINDALNSQTTSHDKSSSSPSKLNKTNLRSNLECTQSKSLLKDSAMSTETENVSCVFLDTNNPQAHNISVTVEKLSPTRSDKTKLASPLHKESATLVSPSNKEQIINRKHIISANSNSVPNPYVQLEYLNFGDFFNSRDYHSPNNQATNTKLLSSDDVLNSGNKQQKVKLNSISETLSGKITAVDISEDFQSSSASSDDELSATISAALASPIKTVISKGPLNGSSPECQNTEQNKTIYLDVSSGLPVSPHTNNQSECPVLDVVSETVSPERNKRSSKGRFGLVASELNSRSNLKTVVTSSDIDNQLFNVDLDFTVDSTPSRKKKRLNFTPEESEEALKKNANLTGSEFNKNDTGVASVTPSMNADSVDRDIQSNCIVSDHFLKSMSSKEESLRRSPKIFLKSRNSKGRFCCSSQKIQKAEVDTGANGVRLANSLKKRRNNKEKIINQIETKSANSNSAPNPSVQLEYHNFGVLFKSKNSHSSNNETCNTKLLSSNDVSNSVNKQQKGKLNSISETISGKITDVNKRTDFKSTSASNDDESSASISTALVSSTKSKISKSPLDASLPKYRNTEQNKTIHGTSSGSPGTSHTNNQSKFPVSDVVSESVSSERKKRCSKRSLDLVDSELNSRSHKEAVVSSTDIHNQLVNVDLHFTVDSTPSKNKEGLNSGLKTVTLEKSGETLKKNANLTGTEYNKDDTGVASDAPSMNDNSFDSDDHSDNIVSDHSLKSASSNNEKSLRSNQKIIVSKSGQEEVSNSFQHIWNPGSDPCTSGVGLLNSDDQIYFSSRLEQDCNTSKSKKSVQTSASCELNKTVELQQSTDQNSSATSVSNVENIDLNLQQDKTIPSETNSTMPKSQNIKKTKTTLPRNVHQKSSENLNVQSGGLSARRSTRTKVGPLDHWRNERRQFNNRTGQVMLQNGDADIIAERLNNRYARNTRRSKPEAVKVKLRDNSVNLYHIQNTIDKIAVINPNTGEEEYVYLYRPYSSLLWSLPQSQDPNNPSYQITKCIAGELISFGYIDIDVKKEKETQYSPTNNITFSIVKGLVRVTVNKSKIKLKELDTITIPFANSYSIQNIGNKNAVLFFCTFKAPLFDYQIATSQL